MNLTQSFWNVLAGILNYSLWLYIWIVLAAVIVSWIPLDPYHPTAGAVLRFLRRATEPTFSFFRRTFKLYRNPALAAFTPAVVLLVISFLRIFLVQSIRDMALIGYPVVFLKCITSNFLLGILATVSEILGIYLWIVILALIVAFLPLDPYNSFAQMMVSLLRHATEPVFRYLRRTFQLHQYIKKADYISPAIVIVLIILSQGLISRLIGQIIMLRGVPPYSF